MTLGIATPQGVDRLGGRCSTKSRTDLGEHQAQSQSPHQWRDGLKDNVDICGSEKTGNDLVG